MASSMKRLFYFLLIMTGIPDNVLSQSPVFRFRNYSTENGFPANKVRQTIQDKYGFIWFSAEHYLVKHDGTDFKIYRHDPADSLSLPESRFYDLYCEPNGLFLAGTENGIYYYDYNVDGFKQLVAPAAFKSTLSSLPFSKKGEVWFATHDKLLHRFTIATGKTETFTACNSYIAAVFIDSRNIIWVGTHDGLYKFNPLQNKYELYWRDTLHTIYGAGMVTSIMEDEKNAIWFTGYNSGIYSTDPGTKKIIFYDFKPLHKLPAEFYNISQLTKATINGQHYILSNSSEGVVLLNADNGDFRVARRNPVDPQSLPSDIVGHVFADNTGTLWVATGEGVSKTERKLISFNTLQTDPLRINKNGILSICQGRENNTIWIGTDSAGLLHYDLSQNKVLQQISIRNKLLRPVAVSEMLIDRQNRLWLGTTEGAYIYEPATGKLILFNETNTGRDLFAKTEVSANFIEDTRGNIWIGTALGVSIYDAQLQFIRNLKEEKNNPRTLTGSYVFALYPANDHQVWIATRSLNLYDINTGSFITNFSKNQHSNSPKFIFEITGDGKGNTYFTSTSHIYQLKKGSDSFSIPIFDKYIKRDLRKTMADSKGQLWIATLSSGLLRADPLSADFTYFNARKGLLNNQVMNSWQSKPNDPVFLVMKDGIQYFYPDSMRVDTTPAPLRITNINILEKRVPVDYQLFADSTLKISYKQNVISFEFSLLDYSFTDDITYEYKLDGFNEKWIHADKRHVATYTNLDAGNYVFRVRAKNHSGFDSGQEAIVQLKVIPPFWKTWWFIVLVGLSACSILSAWIWSLEQKVRSQKILNRFATSLYGHNTIEEIFWDVARDSVELLGFVDCVVYVIDDTKDVLVQKAAYGPKTAIPYQILNPIEISIGKGIVGTVAKTGKAERIGNTRKDKRYIVDDERRLSEITVPIVVDEKVFGVIDSEHPEKNFYSRWHFRMLQEIARICAAKISLQVVQDRIRSKIARDLHDDMGSTLSSINIISRMALENESGRQQVNDHLKMINENSGSMLDSMSDIVWAINPSNDTLEKVIFRMKEFASDILEPLNIRYDFVLDGDFKNIKLDLDKRKDFYLVYKEAINNAAKYSNCSHIDILLFNDDALIEMVIKDNGKGFDTAGATNGNGLANMQERARSMKGEFHITSAMGKGTAIALRLKSHD